MAVLSNAKLKVHRHPGIEHRTLAGHEQGVRSMEVWQQTLAPGAVTTLQRHACEEVIIILAGGGEVTLNGETATFGPDTTLIVPVDAVHRIVNTGSEPMLLLAALGMAPVRGTRTRARRYRCRGMRRPASERGSESGLSNRCRAAVRCPGDRHA